MTPQETFKIVDEIKATKLKTFKFESWECGLNSTERKNIARVKKVLNTLDELNRNNLKDESLFYLCSQLIKSVLGEQYIIKCSGDTYSIKKKGV